MPDVTEEELRQEITKILKDADLAKTSTNKVIQKLELELGTELAHKKDVIDKLVLEYVNSQASEDDEEDEEEEEEEKKKPAKRSAPANKRGKKARKPASDDDDEEDSNDSEYEKPVKRSAATNKRSKKARKGTSDEEEDDDDNDSEYEEKKPKPKKAAAKSKKGAAKGGGRGKGGGYTRAYRLSPALSDLMGATEMPRHEVVKRVWAIIKEKGLYDPSNKQFAICDDALYKVIGTKRFRIFGMMKYLTSHFMDD